ncbi:MAG: agmatine deiminase family protein [Candidatus Zixiibacteriota bacterium]
MRAIILLFLVAVMLICIFAGIIYGRDEFLPKSETNDEKEGRIEKLNKISSSVPNGIDYNGFWDMPDIGVRTPAEFESSQGLIISWSTYDWYTTSIFIELLQNYHSDNYAYIVVLNENERDNIKRIISENEISLGNIKFLEIQTNSCWIRDYSPIFVYDYRDTLAAIDMLYYPEREDDDNFPQNFSIEYEIPHYNLELFLEGGNFMTDGEGLIITTQALYTANSWMPEEQIDSTLMEYFGADRIVALQALEYDATSHVDMFAKLIDAEHIVISIPTDTTYDDYHRMRYNISILETLSLSSGAGIFEVIELPMYIEERSWPPGYNYNTYSNSVIIDEQVFVPRYDNELDDSAMTLYENIMPDYDIESIDCSAIVNAGGAVHCLVMQIPDARKLSVESGNSYCKPEILGKVYPNPFNSSVNIEIAADCPQAGPFTLNIYNLIGKRIKHFDAVSKSQIVVWDGRDSKGRLVVSGLYLITVTDQKGYSEYKKVIYSK